VKREAEVARGVDGDTDEDVGATRGADGGGSLRSTCNRRGHHKRGRRCEMSYQTCVRCRMRHFRWYNQTAWTHRQKSEKGWGTCQTYDATERSRSNEYNHPE
jgi:hypothetical protein